jgi:endonuclease I
MQTAVYGTDTPNAQLNLMYSQDQLTWISLANYTPTSTLSFFHVDVDLLSLFVEEVYDPSLPMYIKIVNMNHATPLDGVRINVDSLVINTIQEPILFPTLDHQNEMIAFSYSDPIPDVLELNTMFEVPTCWATHTVTLDSLSCQVSGLIDTSRKGVYSLSFFVVDSHGYTIEDRYVVTVLNDVSVLDYDFEGFYDGLEGLYGRSLLLALRRKGWDAKINQPYSEGKTVLPRSDANPLVEGEAIAIYTGHSLSSVWDGGVTWQREHVWPNSRLGVRRVAENDANIASDLHNLRFIESSINASRSNKWFDEQTTSSTYFPGEDAGDVARILLYMVTMYDHLSLSNTPFDDLVYMVQGAQLGKIDYLLNALQNDPVSSFERTRNDVLINTQGNPNPFIEYPHFADLVVI